MREILQDHPDAYVFGSRVKGNHKKFSDVDLCFVLEEPMKLSEIGGLSREFEDSNLPFKVDVVDYHSVSEEFQKVIDKYKVPFPY